MIFPSPRIFCLTLSKPWKNPCDIFQALENFAVRLSNAWKNHGFRFPMLGKPTLFHFQGWGSVRNSFGAAWVAIGLSCCTLVLSVGCASPAAQHHQTTDCPIRLEANFYPDQTSDDRLLFPDIRLKIRNVSDHPVSVGEIEGQFLGTILLRAGTSEVTLVHHRYKRARLCANYLPYLKELEPDDYLLYHIRAFEFPVLTTNAGVEEDVGILLEKMARQGLRIRFDSTYFGHSNELSVPKHAWRKPNGK